MTGHGPARASSPTEPTLEDAYLALMRTDGSFLPRIEPETALAGGVA